MRSRALIVGLLVSAGLVGSAWAEEIIYFKNGTTLPIRSHNVVDGMVHVDLGSDALMAFPQEQVERIVAAGKDVYLSPSFRRANVSAPGLGGDVRVDAAAPSASSFPVRATRPASRSVANGTVVRGNDRKGSNTAWQIDGKRNVNDFGMVTEYPASSNPNAAARRMGVVGRRSVTFSEPGDNGAVQIGDKQGLVVTSRSRVPRNAKPDVMRLQPTGGAPAPQGSQRPPAEGTPADAGSSGASSGGDGN